MTNKNILRLHESDNVAIAMANLEEGVALTPFEVSASTKVPRGHKVALQAIEAGEKILKYGQIIGVASQKINAGEHVHVQNVTMAEHGKDYDFGKTARTTEMVPEPERATFQGFRRPDGKVGTRNYVGIVTSVNCAATAAQHIAKEAEKRGLIDNYPNVDGIVPIIHGAGCGHGTDDEAFYKLQRTIWGFAMHPNFASVLMLGLGCEANQIPFMLETYGNPPPEKFRYYTLQGEGGTRKTVERGLEWLEESPDQRQQRDPRDHTRV